LDDGLYFFFGSANPEDPLIEAKDVEPCRVVERDLLGGGAEVPYIVAFAPGCGEVRGEGGNGFGSSPVVNDEPGATLRTDVDGFGAIYGGIEAGIVSDLEVDAYGIA
jgi:hypothetical protein